ncbi:M14 family metallopeptidase [Maribacter sp. PR1]|uniref:M14 family metallopeptidase n=1 Tax=Maribacter cobaltidurans TaxID=1178778 RepID=A0ABU7IYC4_9FLAO|nr:MULTISPECIES: M14 family metallopeptidase [Maribacter]MDC6390131.1 M14 family metallopeptidase [Maribacter sp. PR1]MEE1977521.1 M14 family metallopeptidase [Maribacter cobaltidurans]
MKHVLSLIAIAIFLYSCETKTEDIELDFPTTFETSRGTETATYEEVISFYLKLAKEFPEVNIQTIGKTDSNRPLHLVTYNLDSDFNFNHINKDKTILFVNNGIHPGESDGIDATMLLFRDLASGKIESPKKTVIVTIPIYNVGGSLNRNSTSRANQNGPKSYGFRGNALNYDLNRDFIKTDTKNARTFAQIFHLVNPDIFIDNHVSNGADYQYTLTHLFTQHNKLGGSLGKYVHESLMPSLEDSLAMADWDITPYVNVFNKPPEVGFTQFMDHPRYSTGYTSLWNTLGMMVETHMLKPYKKRVEGTYTLMKKMITISEKEGQKIQELRNKTNSEYALKAYYPIQWEIDSSKSSTLKFKGFKADTLVSEVTGFNRLKYNREEPFTKDIVYYDSYKPRDSVKIPESYLIKKQWTSIIDLLNLNEVEFDMIKNDTILEVESYKIENFNTYQSPYEGHYLHYNTKVVSNTENVFFEEGDVLVPTDQDGIRYILETLEPSAVDSFFNWNFFDTILQQKEGFSPYVFEDTAYRLLLKDSILRKDFEAKKLNDKDFSENWYEQLSWIFERSEFYEKAHNQYPVYRIPKI